MAVEVEWMETHLVVVVARVLVVGGERGVCFRVAFLCAMAVGFGF